MGIFGQELANICVSSRGRDKNAREIVQFSRFQRELFTFGNVLVSLKLGACAHVQSMTVDKAGHPKDAPRFMARH